MEFTMDIIHDMAVAVVFCSAVLCLAIAIKTTWNWLTMQRIYTAIKRDGERQKSTYVQKSANSLDEKLF
jgi:hypothetical protein